MIDNTQNFNNMFTKNKSKKTITHSGGLHKLVFNKIKTDNEYLVLNVELKHRVTTTRVHLDKNDALELINFLKEEFNIVEEPAPSKFKFKVNLWESERGWGTRLDEIKEFDTYDEAESFIVKFNSSNNKESVPDWYMTADRANYNEM